MKIISAYSSMKSPLLAFILLALAGCVTKSSTQGVKNLWRADSPPVFERGKSTEHDVLSALGPPSQVISAGSQTVFYYLLETKESHGLILVVYDQTTEHIIYDRAIFFFDAQGLLKEFATSDEKVPFQ